MNENDLPIRLRDEEEVLLIGRPHWLRLVLPIIGIAFIFLTPFFFLWPLFQVGMFGIILFCSFVGIAIILGSRELYRWRNSVMVITSLRIAARDQRAYFDHAVDEVFHNQIQDVRHEVKGFWQTVGNFGNLLIFIEGRGEPVQLQHQPDPHHIRQLLLELRGSERFSDVKTSDWWWQRLQAMSDQERNILFSNVISHMGEEAWRDLFRPTHKEQEQNVDEEIEKA